jgi:hypothetical protein
MARYFTVDRARTFHDVIFTYVEKREPDRVVATACTNVADRHAWLQFKKRGDLTGLIQGVAVLFGGAAWADNPCNRALR